MRNHFQSQDINPLRLVFFLAFVVALPLLFSMGVSPAQAAKGGGKVTVTEANPPEATQGEELDVFISGSGFDDGSTATYLVSRTNDDTQIQVLTNEFLPATGRLKTRIRVNGNANVNDYDIEVRNSRGRRGKGTTLFRVKQSQASCANPEPTFVYVVETGKSAEIWLSNKTGCNETLMVSFSSEETTFLSSGPSLDIRGTNGIIAWDMGWEGFSEIYGVRFTANPDGSVTPEQTVPELLYATTTGGYVGGIDTHMDESGAVSIVFIERKTPGERRVLSLLDTASLEVTEILGGSCPLLGPVGECNWPFAFPAFDPTGSEIYFNVFNYLPDSDPNRQFFVSRLSLVDSTWSNGVLIQKVSSIGKPSISLDGLMAKTYRRETGCHKNGKWCYNEWMIGILDPDNCQVSPCTESDGEIGNIRLGNGASWTSDGTLLFGRDGVREFIDPLNAIEGDLHIRDATGFDNDL